MTPTPSKQRIALLCCAALAIFTVILFAATIGKPSTFYLNKFGQEYIDLARGFTQGKLFLVPPINATNDSHRWIDVALYDGRLFLPFGPFPAILFVPFLPFTQWINPVTFIVSLGFLALAILMFFLAKKKGISSRDALWISVAYVFGSAILPAILGVFSSWTALLVANVLLLASLYEFLTRRRLFLIGILLSAAMATRLVSYIGIATFIGIGIFFFEKKSLLQKCKDILVLATPLIVTFVVLGLYNFARFGDFFETGYIYQWQTFKDVTLIYGSMHWRYIPANLYAFLIRPPIFQSTLPYYTVSPQGLGLFFGSPFLILLFRYRWRDTTMWAAAASLFIGLLPALFFYANGHTQIGYRYALDIYPLLWLLFIMQVARHGLDRLTKVLIVIASLNFFWWTATFFLQPGV